MIKFITTYIFFLLLHVILCQCNIIPANSWLYLHTSPIKVLLVCTLAFTKLYIPFSLHLYKFLHMRVDHCIVLRRLSLRIKFLEGQDHSGEAAGQFPSLVPWRVFFLLFIYFFLPQNLKLYNGIFKASKDAIDLKIHDHFSFAWTVDTAGHFLKCPHMLLWGYFKGSFAPVFSSGRQSVANVHSHCPLLASTLITLHKLLNYLLPIPQEDSLHICWADSG